MRKSSHRADLLEHGTCFEHRVPSVENSRLHIFCTPMEHGNIRRGKGEIIDHPVLLEG